eukprot:TRINITY_DN49877_c0_g1_i1.p1 TRINITY_DN49877_c0_g1~~TRINITY_DN49877_c0_g1_i1.p1  ORF type:complete len:297 (-),score=39.24 TRINITY_DN49877_c0_g1_i1:11-826(-)
MSRIASCLPLASFSSCLPPSWKAQLRSMSTSAASTAASTAGLPSDRSSRPRLTYLDIKGVGEAIRLTLYIGEVDFEDRRVSYEEVARMRSRGDLLNGQVPLLEVFDERSQLVQRFGHSQAILRWAGKKAGLYPDDLQLQCDTIEEQLVDMRQALRPQWYGSIMREPGEKMVPLSEAQRMEVERLLNEKVLPSRFAQLEEMFQRYGGGGPYFCGSRMTICDLSFYVYATGILDGSFVDGISPSVLNRFPKLISLVQRIEENPKVKEWNQKRN